MLISLNANKESFKKVKFKSGLNIILAERTKHSTKGDSRNGLGKTSMIEIIHFLMGGNITDTLKKPSFKDWIFTLRIKLKDKEYLVSRKVEGKKNIFIDGDCSDWIIKPEKDENGKQFLSNDEWKKVLGKIMFNIEKEYPDCKYVPSFRSLFPYFARLDKNGGFLSAFEQCKSQREWNIQLSNSYLMGLDWTYASKWQILKDKEKVLSQLKNEIKSGILKDMYGTVGELEAEKIRLDNKIRSHKFQLNNFRVHPQYNEIESTVNKITKIIHDNINKNINDKNILENYKNNLREEEGPDIKEMNNVYEEVGIIMPNLIKKRLSDVKLFHMKIIKNRKDFLNSEIIEIENRINKKQIEIQNLSNKRADSLDILKKNGALEEYTELQKVNTIMVSEFEDIKKKINNLKKFEDGRSSLKVDMELLQQKARISLEERSKIKEQSIKLFNMNSESLYNSPGNLSIDVKEKGYDFHVQIKREGSRGIGNMGIYCYDLMKMQLLSQGSFSPGFLIHDSIIFADVDERQIAQALELARKESEDKKFQYICTLNSDNIPEEDFSDGFNIKDFVILTLKDVNDDGGLFGFSF